MRVALLFFLLLNTGNSFSQDTTVAWIQNLDTTSFKMFYNKKKIPKKFYEILGVKSIGEIANPKDNYSPSCVGSFRGQLHWIAKQENRWVFFITRGSSAVCDMLYFIDLDNHKVNANLVRLPGTYTRNSFHFRELVAFINSGLYEFENDFIE
ncbi:hypothetical protein [Fluviicola sp.]|uniref:hypothetical protein n=1 Tax=Fluviicola sp. TaxID=1917219 RepID=UPI003D2A161D